MSPTIARYTITELRRLSITDADRKLCDMHSESLHAIGAELGLRLPLVGGDKPCIIVGALFRTHQ